MRVHVDLGVVDAQLSTSNAGLRRNLKPEERLKAEKDYFSICFCVNDSQSLVDSCFKQAHGTGRDLVMKISRDSCRVQQRQILVEGVSEGEALSLLQAGLDKDGGSPWLSMNESVVLDIDEDYYGCQAGIAPLLKAGMSVDQVNTLSTLVSRLFCTSTAALESLADIFFRSLVETAVRIVEACKADVYSDCRQTLPASWTENALSLMSRDRDKATINISLIFCNSNFGDQLMLNDLFHQLVSMRRDQLTVLARVGICLRESVATFGFNPALGMTICIGYNRPTASKVFFHTPDDVEISVRSGQLRKMVGHASLVPKLVTLCRSVRDGYTPRDLAGQIEGEILTVLNSVPGITRESTYYDKNLLGGQAGWWDRKA